MLGKGGLRSVIFWGPPGTGKTTVARLIAEGAGLHFEQISAIYSGVQELRKLFDAARDRRKMGLGTVLFVDEIHRFNRAQQDGFLPVMEDGTIILIGATTENPSFELNGALLSRATVLVFRRLDEDALEGLLRRAEALEKRPLPLARCESERFIGMADGDGRTVLNLAESVYAAVPAAPHRSTPETLVADRAAPRAALRQEPRRPLRSDQRLAQIRARLRPRCGALLAGADAGRRRGSALSSPGVSCAWPWRISALPIRKRWRRRNAAKDAYDFLGSPEGELALAQATLYLATAPKSNAAYVAFKRATSTAKEHGSLAPRKSS